MKIVMIDQDGVLLDKNYNTTVDVHDFFQKLSAEIKVVPNSDTPVKRIIKNFVIATGIQSDVIIGEKGAVVVFGGKNHFIGNVRNLNSYLRDLKSAFANLDCDVITGDSATWVKEKKKFKPNRRMLIIDGLRNQTVGFYIRTTNSDGVACLDNIWFNVGVALAKSITLPAGLEGKDFNARYGIAIMNVAGVSKTDGYRFLKLKYPKAVFYMIGDGDMDIINDPNVIHCAVANASADFKKIARFVSSEEITAGLIDCLRWIAKQ